MSGEVSYKTHILVGARANGEMTVIADWPHLPKQADVQKEIDGARDGYVIFALCTPTSIMHPGGGAHGAANDRPSASRRRG